VITDDQAKAIARLWATEDPFMMAFLRTGSIDEHLIESLVTDVRLLGMAIAEEPSPPVVAYAQLRALVHYMWTNGPRGARPSWDEIGHEETVPDIGAWMTADASLNATARQAGRLRGRHDIDRR
jgi:hypothetical protein